MEAVYFDNEYVDTHGQRIVGDRYTYWIIDGVRYRLKEATADGYYFVRLK